MENEKTIRIAQIIGKWVGGGVESVVMNYYRNIDRKKIQFDFFCDNDSTNIPYEEIESLGGKVILIPPYQKIFKYHKELKKLLKEGNYNIVHSHINTLSVFSLFAAKMARVPVRIAHSHSTTNKIEMKTNLIKKFLRPFSKVFATDYYCCTEHAGRWLFGNKAYDKGKVKILNNAINLNNFKYNKNKRDEVRKKLGIEEDTLVVGHIGRFVTQKNHTFLIDIFNELYKKNNNSILLLAGQGPKVEEIKEKVKKIGLTEKVKFLGQRNDLSDLYQAFDVFLLPSIYEGLGIVLIEAQVSGVYCIASNKVPSTAKITDNIEFLSLDSPYEWSEKIIFRKKSERRDFVENAQNKEFDITREAIKLQDYYENKNLDFETIEFFGVPASGKSVISKNRFSNYINLNERYIYNSNRLIRNIKKIVLASVLMIKKPILFYKSIKLLRKNKFTSYKKKMKMFLYLISTLEICLKMSRKKEKRVLLEEGILQVLWGICYNSIYSKEFIENFITLYYSYIADKIYYINTDSTVIKKRLLERNSKAGSELEHDIKKDESVLNKARDIEISIIKELQKRHMQVVSVDGGE